MAEFVEDVGIYPTMIELLTQVELENDRSGLPVLDFTSVQPGSQPVIDHVGNGKQCSELVVNLVSTFPTQGFPNPDPDGSCGTELAYEIQVAVFRCAKVPKGNSASNLRLPTEVDMLESTRLHTADMAAMHRAICKALKGKRKYVLRGFTPYGPEGGAVGGTWLLVVGPEDDD